MNSKKVLVGISGGVDSTFCAHYLQEQGYIIEGAVINFSEMHADAVETAKTACEQLGIPLHIIDAKEDFKHDVIEPFCKSYCNGTTPNPCIYCNPLVKFKLLCEKADELSIPYIATGHYARTQEKDGLFFVRQALSIERDQSYMLYRLQQNVLSRLILPVGEFEKTTVRKATFEAGYTNANAPDSQEICFIKGEEYATYIEGLGYSGLQGNFIAPNGEIIGEHKGVLHYTIGQRRGLHVALGKPVFVKSIESNGDILLGYAGDEFYNSVSLIDFVATDENMLLNDKKCMVKVRSAARPAPCAIQTDESGIITLIFDEPVRAPAPGQSAVLYDGELVVGGGIIHTAYA